MDEPTNNLDLESVEALSQAVANFPGGVVLVSHDQTFVAGLRTPFFRVFFFACLPTLLASPR